jgi:hypothetical protein
MHTASCRLTFGRLEQAFELVGMKRLSTSAEPASTHALRKMERRLIDGE